MSKQKSRFGGEADFQLDQESVIMREGERNFTFEVRENMTILLTAMAHIYAIKNPDPPILSIDWRESKKCLSNKRSECCARL